MTVDDLPLAWRAIRADPHVFDHLPPAEVLALAFAHDLWLRPSQMIPPGAWRYFGFIAGRGFGKSHAIACEIHRRVQSGECVDPALIGPTETSVAKKQVDFLIEVSPPWFRAESYLGGVAWPNGVVAVPYTAEEPNGPRGGNHDLVWGNEIVAWDAGRARRAFDNVTTACRRGPRPQFLWDTTSEGYNEVIAHLLEQNERDPDRFPTRRGTMFENPCLDPDYVRDELAKYVVGSRRYREEVLGEVLGQAAGALWQKMWIDRNRVAMGPSPCHAVVAVDPANSISYDADETGIVRVERPAAVTRHAYVAKDLSGRHAPEVWGDLVVGECVDNGAAGVVIERNNACEYPIYVIRSRAQSRGWSVVAIDDPEQPIPPRQPGTIWVREIQAVTSKRTRATPVATEAEAGRVHHVGAPGDLEALEKELTTWTPGRKSPGRLDAMVHGVTEILELWRDAGEAPRALAALGGMRVARPTWSDAANDAAPRHVGLRIPRVSRRM